VYPKIIPSQLSSSIIFDKSDGVKGSLVRYFISFIFFIHSSLPITNSVPLDNSAGSIRYILSVPTAIGSFENLSP